MIAPLFPRVLLSIIVIQCLSLQLPAQENRSAIRAMIDSVSRDRLKEHIFHLQRAGGHGNRVTYTPGNDSAVQYVYTQLKQLHGLSSVVLDTFYITEAQHPYDTQPLFNIIATIQGKKQPNNAVIIGAHIDCSASRMGAAIWHDQWSTMKVPGADDNASGVAGVLELARVMSESAFSLTNDNTIVFAAFGAEESGLVHPAYLVGSSHFAADIKTSGVNVLAMMSLDMIGFNDKNNMYLNITSDTRSQWFGKHIVAMNDTFSIGLTLNGPPFAFGTWSDHSPFWSQGYTAVCLIENAPPWFSNEYYSANPYYHKISDTLETLNMELVQRSTQLAMASTATLTINTASTVQSNLKHPVSFVLGQNYPNPFNAATRITYSLKNDGRISLKVYNILGNEVRTLEEGFETAGEHSVSFTPNGLPSGVYYYRLSGGLKTETRKMVFIQ